MQQGEGIRTGSGVIQGGTMQVEVGPNETTVSVSSGSSSETTNHSVSPNKTASIPVPPVPPGTILEVTVGSGHRRRIILVEVISTGP